jgi:hypothetical protein
LAATAASTLAKAALNGLLGNSAASEVLRMNSRRFIFNFCNSRSSRDKPSLDVHPLLRRCVIGTRYFSVAGQATNINNICRRFLFAVEERKYSRDRRRAQ